MSKYIDALVPTWYRYTIDDDVDITDLVDKLKSGYPISNITDIIEINNFEIEKLITDEEYSPIEIEIYDEYSDLIYDWEL